MEAAPPTYPRKPYTYHRADPDRPVARLNPEPHTLDLKPQKPNLHPETLNPKLPNPKPQPSNPKPQTSHSAPTSHFKPHTQVDYWYFELLEMARKLFMTAILVFVSEGSAGQILVTTLFYFIVSGDFFYSVWGRGFSRWVS